MDNGLRGRYLPQLEAWNNAQKLAADLVDSYFEAGRSIKQTLDEWNLSEQNVLLPDFQKIKQIVSNTIFVDGHTQVYEIAFQIKGWTGWREVNPPEVFGPIEESEQQSASGVPA